MEITVVYFENHAEKVNKLYGKGAYFSDLNLKAHTLSPRL
jgi:hypothetical protein